MDITLGQKIGNDYNCEGWFVPRFSSHGKNLKPFRVGQKDIYYSEVFSKAAH